MNSHNSQQVNRIAAIDAELSAISCQAHALEQISIEHSHGHDPSSNNSVAHYERHANDLVASLKQLLRQLPSMDPQARMRAISGFKATTNSLKTNSEQLVPERDAMAQAHLDQSLAEPVGQPFRGAVTLLPMATLKPGIGLKIEAHKHCHAAETSQIRSFVAQFQALAELCLETIYVEGELSAQ